MKSHLFSKAIPDQPRFDQSQLAPWPTLVLGSGPRTARESADGLRVGNLAKLIGPMQMEWGC